MPNPPTAAARPMSAGVRYPYPVPAVVSCTNSMPPTPAAIAASASTVPARARRGRRGSTNRLTPSSVEDAEDADHARRHDRDRRRDRAGDDGHRPRDEQDPAFVGRRRDEPLYRSCDIDVVIMNSAASAALSSAENTAARPGMPIAGGGPASGSPAARDPARRRRQPQPRDHAEQHRDDRVEQQAERIAADAATHGPVVARRIALCSSPGETMNAGPSKAR